MDLSSNRKLTLREGIWYSEGDTSVSYPHDGNALCFALEEESFWFFHRSRCIAEAVRRYPHPGVFLDVGGGNGMVTKQLQDLGHEVWLIEPGRSGVENARKRGVRGVICSTLEESGLDPGIAGGIGLFDVLEHLEDDVGFLRQVADHLGPSGRLYLTVPAQRWLWSHDDVAAGHFRRYTGKGLVSTLTQAGFEIEYQTYLFALLPPGILLFRTIPSLLRPKSRAAAVVSQFPERTHRLRGIRKGIDTLFSLETLAMRRGWSLPLGSSLLAIARHRRR